MGCNEIKTVRQKQITESQLKITIERLKQFAILRKNSELSNALEQEQQLYQTFKSTSRNKEQESMQLSKLTQQIKNLETINLLINYCQTLSDQVCKIVRNQGEIDSLQGLIMYIETVIYAAQKLKIQQAQEFNQYFFILFQNRFKQFKKSRSKNLINVLIIISQFK